MQPRRRVLIVETQLKQYRKAFFGRLARDLDGRGIDLRVAYSAPHGSEQAKADTVELEAPVGIEVPAWRLFGDRLLVQAIWSEARAADLVIIEQGNRLLVNYALLALSRTGLKRVAYWGHGFNHQGRPASASEWLKRRLVNRVDWWFAYTDGIGRYLARHGVDPHIITVLHNTIDTEELVTAIRGSDQVAVRRRLGIPQRARIGLFCGSLYQDKKLGFLVEAVVQIRRRHPDFELLIVGDGPQRDEVRAAVSRSSFVHHVGPVFGAARADYFAISDVFLMPGILGVAIVDAFAAGLPVFTTDIPGHGPEIEYLEPGDNGEVTVPDVVAYADAVSRALGDPEALARLRDGARGTAGRLTMGQMVEAFATGIVRCLEERR